MRKPIFIAIIFFSFYSLDLFAQSATIITTPTCENSDKGEIQITLDYVQGGLFGYNPPHTVRFHNTSTDVYGEMVAYNKSFTISELEAGDYEISVELSETVVYNLCATVEKVIEIRLVDKKRSCSEDGYIKIEPVGGIPP